MPIEMHLSGGGIRPTNTSIYLSSEHIILTHDSAIALKYFLDVYLVHLEGVEVPDKDAGVDRVRVLRARLISDFAQIHLGSLWKSTKSHGSTVYTIVIWHTIPLQLRPAERESPYRPFG